MQPVGRIGPVLVAEPALLGPALAELTAAVTPSDGWQVTVPGIARDALGPLLAAGLRIDGAGRQLRSISRHYEEAKGLAALVGSSGRLEISLPMGSAAQELGARVGDVLHVSGQWTIPGRRRRA